MRWVRRRSEAGAKLYFLSSRHVLGIQDSRIPRVFKDSSPSFVCEAATKGGGREGEGPGRLLKAVILRALTHEY